MTKATPSIIHAPHPIRVTNSEIRTFQGFRPSFTPAPLWGFSGGCFVAALHRGLRTCNMALASCRLARLLLKSLFHERLSSTPRIGRDTPGHIFSTPSAPSRDLRIFCLILGWFLAAIIYFIRVCKCIAWKSRRRHKHQGLRAKRTNI